jgi:FMN-dependent NADH-azoreductase
MNRECLVKATQERLIEILVDMNSDSMDRFASNLGDFFVKAYKEKKKNDEIERELEKVPVGDLREPEKGADEGDTSGRPKLLQDG